MRCEPADCRTGTADVVIYSDRCHRHRPCLAVVPPHDPSQQGTSVLWLCSAAPDEERAAGAIPREQHREEPVRFAPEVAEVRAAPFVPQAGITRPRVLLAPDCSQPAVGCCGYSAVVMLVISND